MFVLFRRPQLLLLSSLTDGSALGQYLYYLYWLASGDHSDHRSVLLHTSLLTALK